mmetsp:Transcript_37035/g.95645  ORF Transcript_37035/g.95645 Transcript_37035/m.95645 type:complete len:475 (-) Transcript_37035:57-1481(-)
MLQHAIIDVKEVPVGGVLGRLDHCGVDALARLALAGVAVPRQTPQVCRVVHGGVRERGVVVLVSLLHEIHGLASLQNLQDLAVSAVGHLCSVREEVLVVHDALGVQRAQRLHTLHAWVQGADTDHLIVNHGLRDSTVLLRRPVAALDGADDPDVSQALRGEPEGVDDQNLNWLPCRSLPSLADPTIITWVRHVQGVLVVAVGRVLPVHVRVHATLGDVHVARDSVDLGCLHILLHVHQVRALLHLHEGVILWPPRLAHLLLVHPAALGHDLQGAGLVTPAQDLRPLRLPLLRLEQLVVFEEVLDLATQVLRHVVQLSDVVSGALVVQHGNNLLIVAGLILHVHEPHNAAAGQHTGVQAYEGAGLGGRHDEDVQRVAIAAERLRHVAVVARVVHGRVEHAVKHQLARLLLNLVLVRRTAADLNHRGNDVAAILAPPLGLLLLAQPVAERRVRSGRVVADRGKFRDGLIRGLLPWP